MTVGGPGGARPRLTVYLTPAGSYAKVSSPGFRWPDDEEERRALSPIQTCPPQHLSDVEEAGALLRREVLNVPLAVEGRTRLAQALGP